MEFLKSHRYRNSTLTVAALLLLFICFQNFGTPYRQESFNRTSPLILRERNLKGGGVPFTASLPSNFKINDMVSANNILYLATNFGIFTSTDAGVTLYPTFGTSVGLGSNVVKRLILNQGYLIAIHGTDLISYLSPGASQFKTLTLAQEDIYDSSAQRQLKIVDVKVDIEGDRFLIANEGGVIIYTISNGTRLGSTWCVDYIGNACRASNEIVTALDYSTALILIGTTERFIVNRFNTLKSYKRPDASNLGYNSIRSIQAFLNTPNANHPTTIHVFVGTAIDVAQYQLTLNSGGLVTDLSVIGATRQGLNLDVGRFSRQPYMDNTNLKFYMSAPFIKYQFVEGSGAPTREATGVGFISCKEPNMNFICDHVTVYRGNEWAQLGQVTGASVVEYGTNTILSTESKGLFSHRYINGVAVLQPINSTVIFPSNFGLDYGGVFVAWSTQYDNIIDNRLCSPTRPSFVLYANQLPSHVISKVRLVYNWMAGNDPQTCTEDAELRTNFPPSTLRPGMRALMTVSDSTGLCFFPVGATVNVSASLMALDTPDETNRVNASFVVNTMNTAGCRTAAPYPFPVF